MRKFCELCDKEFRAFDASNKPLYSEDMLRDVCLGLNSMCVGAESKYFNVGTLTKSSRVLCCSTFCHI